MSALFGTPWTRRELDAKTRAECESLADDLTVHIGRSKGFRCRILRNSVVIADSNPDAGEPRYYATAIGAFRAARAVLERREGRVSA